MKHYYKSGVVVRDATELDVDMLKDKLRESDKQELWAGHHIGPEKALRVSYKKSAMCLTIEINKEPIAMMGVTPDDNKGIVWLLATDKLKKISRKFARHSRTYINMMLDKFTLLYNYVDARNNESIKWLKWCGAKIYEAAPYGIEGKPFHYFEFHG